MWEGHGDGMVGARGWHGISAVVGKGREGVGWHARAWGGRESKLRPERSASRARPAQGVASGMPQQPRWEGRVGRGEGRGRAWEGLGCTSLLARRAMVQAGDAHRRVDAAIMPASLARGGCRSASRAHEGEGEGDSEQSRASCEQGRGERARGQRSRGLVGGMGGGEGRVGCGEAHRDLPSTARSWCQQCHRRRRRQIHCLRKDDMWGKDEARGQAMRPGGWPWRARRPCRAGGSRSRVGFEQGRGKHEGSARGGLRGRGWRGEGGMWGGRGRAWERALESRRASRGQSEPAPA